MEQYEIQLEVLPSAWRGVVRSEEALFALQRRFATRFERMHRVTRLEKQLFVALPVLMALSDFLESCASTLSEIQTLAESFLTERCAPSLQVCLPRVQEERTRQSSDLRLRWV